LAKSWGGHTAEDWSRLGKKIGKRIGKRLDVFFSISVLTIVSLSPSQEDGRGAGSRAGPPFGEEESIWPSTWNYRGNGYHFPVSEAAELLGAELGYRVDCRNLKRRLRDFGIERWPYEQLKHGPSRV
jgi:hypothetical protein